MAIAENDAEIQVYSSKENRSGAQRERNHWNGIESNGMKWNGMEWNGNAKEEII